jgi:hypothetical protein
MELILLNALDLVLINFFVYACTHDLPCSVAPSSLFILQTLKFKNSNNIKYQNLMQMKNIGGNLQ